MPLTLGYWKIRGFAQAIRFLLKYTGLEFENVMYERSDGPDWFSVKYTLGLDFPNLPYLIDGDIKITQSNAIIRYIGRKFDMCGKTDAEKAIVDMLVSTAMDFRVKFTRLCFNPNYDTMREGYIKNIRKDLQQFSDFLGDKKWFAGSEITIVDFMLYEFLDQHRMFEAPLIDEIPNLKGFVERFEALPAIKAYMESGEFLRSPVNTKQAAWFGK